MGREGKRREGDGLGWVRIVKGNKGKYREMTGREVRKTKGKRIKGSEWMEWNSKGRKEENEREKKDRQ